ncbi:MAG: hypothetical protein GC204_00300 [Chloroflexi bacterium]|nr:hypothetical protein [Chloroflexota bacterium]
MILFVMFIFGAVVIGAGAMLAPAWPTHQPRIGLAATLALGVVIGGAIFWAELFGWNTLVVDYLLFALVSSIFLFGTLSYGQKRAEKRGEELSDADQGWTSVRDLLLFGFAGLIFIIPALIVPVPLDTDAQGFGYLALTTRLGSTLDTLAPLHPEIHYLYSPGFPALLAYLNHQLGLGLNLIQMGVAAILCLMLVWLAYDFGSEVQDKRLGRAMALAMLGGLGLFTAYMDSHFTTLLALLFALGFLTYVVRYMRHRYPGDAIAAGLMLGAVVLSHPDMTIILILGYVPWLLTIWLSKPRPTLRTWLVLALGIPLIAVIAIAPWLLHIRDLLGANIVSPFEIDPNNWKLMIFNQGVIIVPFAILGAVIGLRKRDPLAILALGWLLLVFDFSTTGFIARLLPWLPILRYDYPFSIAWHGPIIPYMILGGTGLLWLWDRLFERRIGVTLHRVAPVLLIGASALAVVGLIISPQIIEISKDQVSFFGAFSSAADVAAMEWIKTNAPADARILNYPGAHEGDWVPVLSERDSVYFRPQPFFQGTEAVEAEQQTMLAFWRDPANPANEELLRQAKIGYVIVPQIITDPASIETMVRWRLPLNDVAPMQSKIEDAPYLTKVFDQDGAQVWQVKAAGG